MVSDFKTEAVAAGISAPRSNKTSPVSEFRTTACKVPREGFAASSATEQVLIGAWDSEGVGDALSEAEGPGVPGVKANPPSSKTRTIRPEPAPIRTSL